MEEMKQRVPLSEAAAILGVSPQSVREHMKRGVWDLGNIVTISPKRKQYHIYRAKLNKLIGLDD